MDLTLDEVKQYFAAIGVTLPDFVITILLSETAEIDACLEANYSEGTGKLIKLYLLTLLAIPQSDKYVSSESAPSGASRSYRYAQLEDRWNGTYRLLTGLDKQGCATELIPESPFAMAHGMMFVAKGTGCV